MTFQIQFKNVKDNTIFVYGEYTDNKTAVDIYVRLKTLLLPDTDMSVMLMEVTRI